ncbi:MAG: HAMP domain-containing protein, partial [Massilioclostridium sp.]|nr:HAMP domain-containing protein [Massilioclostridium sp.]
MKLAWKIFLSTITTLALVTSLGGYALIGYNFDQSFQREVSRSFEDLIYVRFSLETAIVNLWSSNPEVSDELLISVAQQLEDNELYRSDTVSVSDEEYNPVYQNKQGDPINALVREVQGSDRIYRLTQDSGYKINSACSISAGNRTVYLQISRDITDLFSLKDRQVRLLTLFILGVLVIGGAGIFGISLLITRPVRRLSAAARAIAEGAYEQRIRATGNDEIAGLARDFNSMA